MPAWSGEIGFALLVQLILDLERNLYRHPPFGDLIIFDHRGNVFDMCVVNALDGDTRSRERDLDCVFD